MQINKKELAIAYDNNADYRANHVPQEWKVLERAHFYNLLLQEKKKSMLEIGAGTGMDSKFFADQAFDVQSIDLSEKMVKYCLEKGLNAKVMDFYNLDFPSESFDAIYALNCLLHVPKADIGQVLLGIQRILKPNGIFYMGVYGGKNSEGVWENDWSEPKRFFSSYTDDDIQLKVREYFELVYFKSITLKPEKPHFQSLILRKKK